MSVKIVFANMHKQFKNATERIICFIRSKKNSNVTLQLHTLTIWRENWYCLDIIIDNFRISGSLAQYFLRAFA